MKIIPRPDELTAPYFEAAAEGRLAIQRCSGCGRLHHTPVVSCPGCHGDAFEWPSMSGRGTLFTYTVVQHSVHPVTVGAIPYIIALVELEEGPRVLANLRDVAPEDAHIGLPVEVFFEELDEETKLPQFRPAG